MSGDTVKSRKESELTISIDKVLVMRSTVDPQYALNERSASQDLVKLFQCLLTPAPFIVERLTILLYFSYFMRANTFFLFLLCRCFLLLGLLDHLRSPLLLMSSKKENHYPVA